MGKLMVFLAASIGGAVGWWLGAMVGTMTAYVLSTVGTGVGIFIARRWLTEYFG
jgi:hypothetical protein